MTNEQLAIYLTGLVARLKTAIEKASDLMPEGAARPAIRAHIASHAKDATIAAMLTGNLEAMRCDDPAHFADVPDGQFTALEPLDEFVGQLENEVAILKEQKK